MPQEYIEIRGARENNFRSPDKGSSQCERFLALDGQADTQPTSGVANLFCIHFST